MAAMEPSPDELKAMRKVSDVFAWIPVKEGQFREELMKALGVDLDSELRILAAIEESDINDVKQNMKIGELKLNPAQKGMVVSVWRVAQLATGVTKTAAVKAEEARANDAVEKRKERRA